MTCKECFWICAKYDENGLCYQCRYKQALEQILTTPIHTLADVITVKAIAENALKVEGE